MTNGQILSYETWRDQLVEVAIRNFDYAYTVIVSLTDGHVFFRYYEDGLSPDQALRSYQEE